MYNSMYKQGEHDAKRGLPAKTIKMSEIERQQYDNGYAKGQKQKAEADRMASLSNQSYRYGGQRGTYHKGN